MALKIIVALLVFCDCSCWLTSAEGTTPEPIDGECTSGFITLDRLTALVQRIRVRHRQQRIIPDINFTCNGVITKWVVGAEWRDNDDWYPDLQLWRETGNGAYTKVGNTTLRVDSENTGGVYEYPVDPPLEFQAGDILGIFQPHKNDSRILVNYKRANGPPNYLMTTGREVEPPLEEFTILEDTTMLNDTPLIAVEVNNPLCTCGFVSQERVVYQRQRQRVSRTQQQRIIPHINFTCDGTITKWIMGANLGNGVNFPELQIWRDIGNDTYTKVGNTPSVNATFVQTGDTNRTYEYTSVPPMEFKAGDVLGVFQPPFVNSGLTVLYDESSGPLNFFAFTGLSVTQPPFETFTLSPAVSSTSALPLVTVEIVASPTVTPQNTGSSSGNSAAVAAGVTIAVLFIIGLCVAIAIVIVAIVFRLKSNKYTPTSTTASARDQRHNLDNPVHEREISPDNAVRYVPKPNYPIPTSRDKVNQIASGTTPDGQYELVAVPSTSSGPTTHFDNPLYADAEPIVMQTTGMMASDSNAQVEWGVYVPTAEQRKTLPKPSSREKNLYVYSAIKQESSQQGDQKTFFEESEIYWVPSSNSAELYAQMAKFRYREIFRHQISIAERLGSGVFGTVDKGVWVSPRGTIEVAVKMLKKEASEKDKIKFLQEAAINGQFHHSNIVQLLGVVTIVEPIMIVLEFIPKGDLRNFLNQQKSSSGEIVPGDMSKLCLKFCHQVASGMAHLSGKSFVHRDLAARNVLVSKDNICKIADFGMARDLEDEDYYVSHGGQVPVKWTAPEALHFKKYSTASDVWSYGAVMYEIWSIGHKPYEGYTNPQVIRLVGEGYRLPPPPGCPKAIYRLMIQCWHPEKSSRPTFSNLQKSLSVSGATLLRWSEEDTRVHPQATVLGAPLEAGKNLYPDLQGTFMS